MEGSRVTRTGIGCQSQTTGESESIRAGSVRVSKKRKVEVTIGSTFDRIRGEKLRFGLFLWFFSLAKLDFRRIEKFGCGSNCRDNRWLEGRRCVFEMNFSVKEHEDKRRG